MDISHKESDYWGKEKEETNSVENFVFQNILTTEPYGYHFGPGDCIRLERQGPAVMNAMGRLISILLDKEVLNLDDLKAITENYDETLELVKNQ
ncbi:hypothetical protein C4577_06620 [Candidatus Parcubacteria bacterium]|nr:MAG: hypothetical protein C4577_06620 [Candidatus Parcubacteria bacterium]